MHGAHCRGAELDDRNGGGDNKGGGNGSGSGSNDDNPQGGALPLEVGSS